MKKRLPKYVIPIVVLVLAVCLYFLIENWLSKPEDTLTVSGTIEAVSSSLSPEIGGKVSQILVDEGDSVKSGDRLFIMDDTLLQAQSKVAQAGLQLAQKTSATATDAVSTAQASYDLALAAARQESVTVRAADWQTANPEGYTLPGGSFTPAELIAAAQAEVDAAKSALEEADTDLNTLLKEEASAKFVDAEQKLLKAKFAFLAASDVLRKATLSSNSDLTDEAQTDYDNALDQLKSAQESYDNLKDSASAEKILAARNTLVLATEKVQAAETHLASLQTGENSLKVQAAAAALAQAQSAADQATASVTQAQANVDLLDAQITKLSVVAPNDGIILGRSIEVGEVVAAGFPALTLGRLDPLSITVYVQEAELGQITMGLQADVRVDAYPEENFSASVTHISDQAEYTPRNVQTTEGRKTTVFAVKLQISNPDGKLKPGMPADVTFNR